LNKINRMIKKQVKYVVLLVFGGITLFPLIYIFFASFKTNAEILTSRSMLPKVWVIDNYIQAWNLANFRLYTWNSIYYAFFIVVGSIITTITLAYVLERGEFVGKRVVSILFISTMFISLGSISLYPQYQVAKFLNVHTSLAGAIMIRVFAINVTQVFVARSFISTIPREIDEAAKMDGCSFIRIYTSVIFPLLKPLIATVGLLSFRFAWNDYMLPLVFTLSQPDNAPLVVGVVNLRNTGEAASSWNLMLAGTMIAVIPMILVYLFLNRFFIQGLTSGSVKG